MYLLLVSTEFHTKPSVTQCLILDQTHTSLCLVLVQGNIKESGPGVPFEIQPNEAMSKISGKMRFRLNLKRNPSLSRSYLTCTTV